MESALGLSADPRSQVRTMTPDTPLLERRDQLTEADQPDLPDLARRARWLVIKTVTNSKAGHIGGPLSMMDLLISLYFAELRIRPEDPDWADRDRFVLVEGPCGDRAVRGAGAAWILRGRRVGHLRQRRFPVAGASGRDSAAGRGRLHRLARAGSVRGRRDGARGPAGGARTSTRSSCWATGRSKRAWCGRRCRPRPATG